MTKFEVHLQVPFVSVIFYFFLVRTEKKERNKLMREKKVSNKETTCPRVNLS